MRKYKHKATGCIAIKSEGHLNYVVTGPTMSFNAPSGIIESGDDWEEVKEEGKSTYYYLHPGNIKATRSNDGTVFQLRDIVRGQIASNVWEEGPILSFEWEEAAYDVRLMAQVGVYKVALEHLEKPVHITTDGVCLYNKSYVIYALNKQSWGICEGKIGELNLTDNSYQTWRTFSTKEARLDYIAENKPLFCVEDIYDSVHLSALEAGNLIIKAKEKLKANDSNL